MMDRIITSMMQNAALQNIHTFHIECQPNHAIFIIQTSIKLIIRTYNLHTVLEFQRLL